MLTTGILTAERLPPVPSVIASTRFEFDAQTYAVELVPGKRAEVTEGREPSCANDGVTPELEGDCELVLKSGPEELSRLALNYCQFVHSKGTWLARSGDDDSTSLPQPKPVTFVGDSQLATAMVASPAESVPNQLYADFDQPSAVQLLREPAGAKDSLRIAGYNNGRGEFYVDQFIEDAPGVWRFIRETTK